MRPRCLYLSWCGLEGSWVFCLAQGKDSWPVWPFLYGSCPGWVYLSGGLSKLPESRPFLTLLFFCVQESLTDTEKMK